MTPQNFPIWKSVTIGKHSIKELRKKLKEEKVNVAFYADSMIEKIQDSQKEETIDFVKVTPKDLGFSTMPTTAKLFKEVQKQGLELVPPEAALVLRLDYKDQRKQERFLVGMKPITDSDGDPNVFGLVRDGKGLWLNGRWADPDHRWDLGHAILLRRRKSLDTSEISNPQSARSEAYRIIGETLPHRILGLLMEPMTGETRTWMDALMDALFPDDSKITPTDSFMSCSDCGKNHGGATGCFPREESPLKEALIELCDTLCPKGGKPLTRGQAILETAKMILKYEKLGSSKDIIELVKELKVATEALEKIAENKMALDLENEPYMVASEALQKISPSLRMTS